MRFLLAFISRNIFFLSTGIYILLLENEYYMIHGIPLLAFVTHTGTDFKVQLQKLSLA